VAQDEARTAVSSSSTASTLPGGWRELQAWVFQTLTREEKLSKKGGAQFSKQSSPKGCPVRDLFIFEGHPEGFLALGRVARLEFRGIAASISS
jgi:hypothetical protein